MRRGRSEARDARAWPGPRGRGATAAAAIALAVGCGSDTPEKTSPPAAPTDRATDDAPGAGPVVFLRDRPASRAERGGGGDVVALDVVARGVARSVHGAAFRLQWQPGDLGFVEARTGNAWSSRALTLAREGLPGELVVAWTERGRGGGLDASGETLLGTLTFERKTRGDVAVAFRAERSSLRDPDGAEVPVTWRGGHVPAR
ncbi:MAG: hypothetical protein KF894_18220 [Labilithrix sp.]|nr:hypothetical protein [Labilithrix sp.]